MAINETREIVIEATPEEILDVIGDFDAVTEWSPPHQSAEVLERHKDGRPAKVKMKVKAAGITDEQVVAYTWSKNKVSWTLVSSGQQRSQDIVRAIAELAGVDSGSSAEVAGKRRDGEDQARRYRRAHDLWTVQPRCPVRSGAELDVAKSARA